MSTLSYRNLRGYTLDPGFSGKLETMTINETTYRIRWEDLELQPETAGICIQGEYFEVIDIDPASNSYYEAVNLNCIEVLSQNGLTPSEGNPKFHQQFVYTIAMKALDHFEQALGRKIIWSPRDLKPRREFVRRLRLYPHALREANAYYDPDKKSILFGYFKAAAQVVGTNFPGGAVFTCLSPDIIVHELTHAVLDSIHPRFLENTNKDVAAFHEAFADIIALLQRFTVNQLVENQLSETRGNLTEFNLLGELATQFGSAIPHGGGALRSAIGDFNAEGKWERRTPDPTLYQTVFEPHLRGSILVAAFFDALIKVYSFKTQDLIAIATNGSGVLPQGRLSKDLIKRLSQELCNISGHLMSIAIRALDYCPPIDINFGDFLRALITADIDSAPADDNNYRVALMESFRAWGIFPENVTTFSEESLKWNAPDNFTANEQKALDYISEQLSRDIPGLLAVSDREQIFNKSNELQRKYHELFMGKQDVLGPEHWNAFIQKLGLAPLNYVYKDEGGNTYEPINPYHIQVYTIRPVFRTGREGQIIEQVIITLLQKSEFNIGLEKKKIFRGGCTIIINLAKNLCIDYVISKNITSQRRLQAYFDFIDGKDLDSAVAYSESMYDDDCHSTRINFAKLHFH